MVAKSVRAPRTKKSSPSSAEDNLAGCYQALADLCESLGFRENQKDAASKARTLSHWAKCSKAIGSWVKFMKYKLAAFFAVHTDQTLPMPPEQLPGDDHVTCLLGGRRGRFLASCLSKSDPQTRLGILASIKLSKKGMPRPDQEMVRKATLDTATKLCTPSSGGMTRMSEAIGLAIFTDDLIESYRRDNPMLVNSSAVADGFCLTKEDIERELVRTVREILVDERYGMMDRMTPFFPSTSANYNNSRSGGGAVGWIVEELKNFEELCKPGGYLSIEMKAVNGEAKFDMNGLGELEDAFSKLWLRLLDTANRERFMVEPVGLAEALKVRVITKGPPAAQTVMKPLQRKLFSALSKFGCFKSLTCGGDLTPEQLLKSLGRLSDGQMFLSGDYEAATDNLESWVSDIVMNEVCDCLKIGGEPGSQTGIERDIAMRLLTGHYIYPKEWEYSRVQRRGQLMGSILSFPVLCIANAALVRAVVEADRSFMGRNGFRRQKLTLQQAQILINGDDLLAKITRSGYKLWRHLGNTMGLKESLGKTYLSDEFLEINSRLYYYTAVEADSLEVNPYRSTPLINLGLLYGLVRSSSNNEKASVLATDRTMSLGARLRTLKSEVEAAGVSEGTKLCWTRLFRIFLRREGKSLESLGLPWHLPEQVGGLGIPGKPSVIDLKLARAALLNELKFATLAQPEWRVWRMVQQQVDEAGGFAESLVPKSFAELHRKMTGLLAVNLLFDSRHNKHLRIESPDAAAGHLLTQNRRIWQRLNRGVYGFPDLDHYKRLGGLYSFPVDIYPELEASAQRKTGKDLLVSDQDEQLATFIWSLITHTSWESVLPWSPDLLFYT